MLIIINEYSDEDGESQSFVLLCSLVLIWNNYTFLMSKVIISELKIGTFND